MAKGHELALFNYDPQAPDWLKGVQIVTGDRTKRAEFEEKFAQLGTFDCVIDMICYEPADAECDVRTFRGRTQQFLYYSTVGVYSKTPAVFPVTEENGNIDALPSFPYAYR